MTTVRAPVRVVLLSVAVASAVACKVGSARDESTETSSTAVRHVDATATLADTLLQPGPETLAVVAKDPTATAQVARIESYRARLDSLLDTREPSVHFYARLAKEDENGCIEPIDSTVAVPDPKKWPDNIESSLVLVVEHGHVLSVREFPFSCSGDWSLSYTHTFDTTGRTVSFERFSGFFSGCPQTTHELSTYYFAPETGSLLAKRYRITDPEGNPFSPGLCEAFNYHYPYSIFSSWQAAAHELHLPLAIK